MKRRAKRRTDRVLVKFNSNAGRQKAITDRVNLGLTLLQMCCIFGEPITTEDQAAWTGVSRQALDHIYQRALRKVRNHLMFHEPKAWAELREAMGNSRHAARARITRVVT